MQRKGDVDHYRRLCVCTLNCMESSNLELVFFLFECLDLVFFELEYLELVFILLEYLELVIFVCIWLFWYFAADISHRIVCGVW